jgi:energy-converting hydrogenase Eha subunit G
MWELLSVVGYALGSIPWWFWLFGVVAFFQKPISKQVKKFTRGGV